MRGGRLTLYLFLMMFCLIILITPLLLAAHSQAKQITVLMFSTEALTPALMLGLALITHLIRRARKA